MKRRIVVWLWLLAFGLQGSMLAFAAVVPRSPDCQTSAETRDHASHKPCCPRDTHTVDCCQGACSATAAVIGTPISLTLYGRPGPVVPLRNETFSTCGYSPLIRPPIL